MERTTPRRSWRTLRVVLIVVLVVAALVALAPQILLPTVERAASDTLGTPVDVGWIDVDLLGGAVSLRNVSFGEGAPLEVDRITARPDLERLLRGVILLERVEIEGLRGTAEQGADGMPALRGLPIPEPGPDAETDGGPPVSVQELVLENVSLDAIPPPALRATPVRVHLDRLVARPVPTAEAGQAYQGELTGTLDGVPLEASARADETPDGWRVEAEVGLEGAPVGSEQLALPAGLESLSATADGKATYLLDPANKTERVTADVALTDLTLAGAGETALAAQRIEVRGLTADLRAGALDLGRVTVERPRVDAALTDDGLVYPGLVPELVESGVAPPARDAEPAWRVTGGAITARDGALAIRRDDVRVRLAVPAFSWTGVASGKRGKIELALRPESGGSLGVRGVLGIDPAVVDLDLELSGLALPELSRLVSLPLALSRGTASGTVQIAGEPATARVEATLEATQVHTAPPREEQPERVLAVDRLEVSLTVDPGPTGAIDVQSLVLSYPYAMVQRDQQGVFPLTALAASSDGSGAPAATPATSSGGRPLRIGNLSVVEGRVDFVDQTTTPAFWTGLANTRVGASGIVVGSALERLELTALQDELHPVRASVRRAGARWTGSAGIEDLSLPTLNPYLQPVLGYAAESGRLTADVDGALRDGSLDASTELSLTDVDMRQTGLDVIQSQTGVPLTVALSLLKDVGGEIELTIPVEVDTDTGEYALGSFVTQAVSRAVLGALSSPLRWLGMLFGTDGPPHALAIDPIPFAAGQGTLDDAGEARIAQIARILASHADLNLVVKAQIAEADVAAVGRDGLAGLAARRVQAVREALLAPGGGGRFAPERILVAPWTPPADGRLDPAPGVYAEVQSR